MKINMSIDEFNKIIKSKESKKRFKDNMKKYGFNVDEAIEYKNRILSYEKLNFDSIGYLTENIDFSNDSFIKESYNYNCSENTFYDNNILDKEVA